MTACQHGAHHGGQEVGEYVLHGVSVDSYDTDRRSPLVVLLVDMLVQSRMVQQPGSNTNKTRKPLSTTHLNHGYPHHFFMFICRIFSHLDGFFGIEPGKQYVETMSVVFPMAPFCVCICISVTNNSQDFLNQ